MSIIDRVILFFLGLFTLRELIASSGIIPKNKKYSFLVYNNYDNYIVKQTLEELGLQKSDMRTFIAEKDFLGKKHKVGLENLIEIISRYMIYHNANVEYGYKIKIQTAYYICTVESSYDEEYLRWMCALMRQLIWDKYHSGYIDRFPDFIITPKGGNTHFGRTFAERNNLVFITSKYSIQSTYVTYVTGAPEFDFKTNYEGAWHLFQKQSRCGKDEKLYGIVIDCNTATGEQLINTMINFNDLLNKMSVNIMPIKDAFTLYRPVNNQACDVDVLFDEYQFQLHRYFDLSEEDKTRIFKERGKKGYLSAHDINDRNRITNVLSQLQLL